jgi:hypothetical protein
LGSVAGEQLSLLAQRAPSSIPEGASVDTFAIADRAEREPTGQRPQEPHEDQPREPYKAQPREPRGDQPAKPDPEDPTLAAALATLSYTSLSELERCGYRYYLERVLGLREDRSAARADPGQRGLEARARGTLIHRLLETVDLTKASPPSPGQVARVARELGMRVAAGEREEIAALIGAAMAAEPGVRVAAARAVRREHPFAFSLAAGEPLIGGVIDLLAREPDGGMLVLDYKSDRVGPEVDLGALVEREYSIQRLLYALAVLRDGAPKVEIVHWFLERPHEAVAAHYLAAERGTLERRLTAHLARARATGFAVSPSPHRGLCLTCPGRAGLCSWDEQATLRESPTVDPTLDPTEQATDGAAVG